MDQKGYIISGLTFLPTFFQRKKVDQKNPAKSLILQARNFLIFKNYKTSKNLGFLHACRTLEFDQKPLISRICQLINKPIFNNNLK